jgi:hypothetical protein
MATAAGGAGKKMAAVNPQGPDARCSCKPSQAHVGGAQGRRSSQASGGGLVGCEDW